MSKSVKARLGAALCIALVLALSFTLGAVFYPARGADGDVVNEFVVRGEVGDLSLSTGDTATDTVMSAAAATDDWVWYNDDINVKNRFKMNVTVNSPGHAGDRWIGLFLFPGELPKDLSGATHTPTGAFSLLFRMNCGEGAGQSTVGGDMWYNGSQVGSAASVNIGTPEQSMETTSFDLEYVFYGTYLKMFANGTEFCRFDYEKNADFVRELQKTQKAHLAFRFQTTDTEPLTLTVHSVENSVAVAPEYNAEDVYHTNNITSDFSGTGEITADGKKTMSLRTEKPFDASKAFQFKFKIDETPGYHENGGLDAWFAVILSVGHNTPGNFGSANNLVAMIRTKNETHFNGEFGQGSSRTAWYDGPGVPMAADGDGYHTLEIVVGRHNTVMKLDGTTVSTVNFTLADFPNGAFFSFTSNDATTAANNPDGHIWKLQTEIVNTENKLPQITVPESELVYTRTRENLTVTYAGDDLFGSLTGNGIVAANYEQNGAEKTLTLDWHYLETLENGAHTFTVIGADGSSATFTVVVSGEKAPVSILTPIQSFDKGAPQDAATEVIFNGQNEFASFTADDSSVAVTDADYTFADGTLTVKQSFLSRLRDGVYWFTVSDSAGNTGSLGITVYQTLALDKTSAAFDKSSDERADVVLTLTAGGLDGTVACSDTAFLTSDYTYNAETGVITFSKDFFIRAENGVKTFTLTGFGENNTAAFTVTVSGRFAYRGFTANDLKNLSLDETKGAKLSGGGGYVNRISLKDGVTVTFSLENIAEQTGSTDQWIALYFHTEDNTGFQSGKGLSILMRNRGGKPTFEMYVNGAGGSKYDETSTLDLADTHEVSIFLLNGSWMVRCDGIVRAFPQSQFGEDFDPQYINIGFNDGTGAMATRAFYGQSVEAMDSIPTGGATAGLTVSEGTDGYTDFSMDDKKELQTTVSYSDYGPLDIANEIVIDFKMNQIPGYHSDNAFDCWFGVFLSKAAGDANFANASSLIALIRPQAEGKLYGTFGNGTAMPSVDENSVIVDNAENNVLRIVARRTGTDFFLNGVKVGTTKLLNKDSFPGGCYLSYGFCDNGTAVDNTASLWNVSVRADNTAPVQLPQITLESSATAFDKAAPADVVLTVGGTDTFVSLEAEGLQSQYYAVNGNTITVSKDFFLLLANQTGFTFTVTGEDGSTAEYALDISGEPVVKQIIVGNFTRSFDKSAPKDLTFPISGEAFQSLTGEYLESAHYAYDAETGVLTMKKEFFLILQPAVYTFTVTGESGSTAPIQVTVTGVTYEEIAVSAPAMTFDKAAPQDIVITVTAGEFDSITASGLMTGDYTVSGNIITIHKAYLSLLENGAYEFRIHGKGANNATTVTVTVSGVAAPPSEVPSETPAEAGCGCGGNDAAAASLGGTAIAASLAFFLKRRML